MNKKYTPYGERDLIGLMSEEGLKVGDGITLFNPLLIKMMDVYDELKADMRNTAAANDFDDSQNADDIVFHYITVIRLGSVSDLYDCFTDYKGIKRVYCDGFNGTDVIDACVFSPFSDAQAICDYYMVGILEDADSGECKEHFIMNLCQAFDDFKEFSFDAKIKMRFKRSEEEKVKLKFFFKSMFNDDI